MQDQRIWRTYIHDRVLTGSAIHAMCETWQTPQKAGAYAEELKRGGVARMYSATGGETSNGTGCALVLANCKVERAKDEGVVYARADGKALAVHLTFKRRKTLVLVTHTPAESDEKLKEEFYRSVGDELRSAYASGEHGVLGSRDCIWVGDHNHIGSDSDCEPRGARALALGAEMERRRLSTMIGATTDAYRRLEPRGADTTHSKAAYSTRLDRAYVSETLMLGTQRIHEVTHEHPARYGVAHRKGGEDAWKASDHHVVRLLYRVSSTEQARRGFTYASEILHTKEGVAGMMSAIGEVLKQGEGEADREKVQEALVRALQEHSSAERRKRRKETQKGRVAAQRHLSELVRRRGQQRTKESKDRVSGEIREARRRLNALTIEEDRQRARRRLTREQIEAGEDDATVHGRYKPKMRSATVSELERKDEDGETVVETTPEGVHRAMGEYWAPVFRTLVDEAAAVSAGRDELLGEIHQKFANRLSASEKRALSMQCVLTRANIRAAIKALKEHTAPGQDGIPVDVYRRARHDDAFIDHLIDLYNQILRRKTMTHNMKNATTTMIYKNKGRESDPHMYRPITVTASEYRILGAAMAGKLQQVMHKLIGRSQIGFRSDAEISENIELMTETIRYCNNDAPERGGAIAICDNEHAFDYVDHGFLWRVLRAFGLPDSFCRMVEAMYDGATTRLKVNDTLGKSIDIKGGCKQGCTISPALYAMTMECLLTLIRKEEGIKPLRIPGELGGDAEGEAAYVKERALADDLAVYMSDPAASIPKLREVLDRFRAMSGQRLNVGKSCVLLLGKDVRGMEEGVRTRGEAAGAGGRRAREWWPGMRFTKEGMKIDKYHGVQLGTTGQVAEQWEKAAAELMERADFDDQIFTPRGLRARKSIARSRHFSRVLYPFRYQVPEPEKVEEVIEEIQRQLDRVVLGKSNWVRLNQARQRRQDGGLGTIDVRATLRAEWASRIRKVLEPSAEGAEPWKNYTLYYLRQAYGPELSQGKRLLTANLSYHRVTSMKAGKITERARQAFKAYGALPRLRPAQVKKPWEQGAGVRLQRALMPKRDVAVVYRALREDEDPRCGLEPPGQRRAGMTTTRDAVKKGSRAASHVISTSLNPVVCLSYAEQWTEETQAAGGVRRSKSAHRIVAIRISAVEGSVHDLDAGEREREGVAGDKAAETYARRSREVVIQSTQVRAAYVPPEAIVASIDTSKLDLPARTRPKPGESGHEAFIKKVPEKAREVLADFARKAEEEVQRLERGEAARDWESGARSTRSAWRREEIERQHLLHNLYLEEVIEEEAGGEGVSGRSSAETEEAAKRWADSGCTRVRDVLALPERVRFLTVEEWSRKYTELSGDRALYAQLLRAVPKEWATGLRSPHADSHRLHSFHRLSSSLYEERWSRDDGQHAAQRWEREEEGIRLQRVGETRVTARRQATMGRDHEVRVQRVKTKEKQGVDASFEACPASMKKCRDLKFPLTLCGEVNLAGENPEEIVVQASRGLVPPRARPLSTLGVKGIRELETAKVYEVARAWDPRSENPHYPQLYKGVTPTEYAQVMRRVLESTSHPAVPLEAQTLLTKTYLSGHQVGHKTKDPRCLRCAKRRSTLSDGEWSTSIEAVQDSLEHSFARCPGGVDELWRRVIRLWNENMGEEIDPEDDRVRLLVDRGEGESVLTEETWRVVHAATVLVIDG